VAFPISGAKQNTQTKIVVGHPDRPVLESDASTRPFPVFIFENMAGQVFIVPITNSI
jgi:hypothetical protein